jgi:hypothetical protein
MAQIKGGGAPAAAASSTTGKLSLTVANAGSQSGSDWTDSGDLLVGTFPALRTGASGKNQTAWGGDVLIWDLSDLFGEDILVSASPVLTMDWLTDTGPGEASILGFGFCTAANLAGANIGTLSRWVNLHNDGASEEGISAKKNTSTGSLASTRASPGLVRVSPVLVKEEWVYLVTSLNHGDTGTNPFTSPQSGQDTLTGANKVFAWLTGGPASAAVGEVVYKGELQVNYGGGRS